MSPLAKNLLIFTGITLILGGVGTFIYLSEVRAKRSAPPPADLVKDVLIVPNQPRPGSFDVPVLLQLMTDPELRSSYMVAIEGGPTVTLKRIDDWRCPAGATCSWAGEVAAALLIEGGSLEAPFEFQLSEFSRPEAVVQGYVITLQDIAADHIVFTVSQR